MSEVIDGLSLSSQDPINTDIIITYTPSKDVLSYEYEIIKDGRSFKTYKSIKNDSVNIVLTDTGVYEIIVKEANLNGVNILKSGTYTIDKIAPSLEVSKNLLEVKNGHVDLLANIKAHDNLDGDITSLVTTNISSLDLKKPGLKELTYTVSDEAGNLTSKSINLNVVNPLNSLFYIQFALILLLILLLIIFMSFNKSVKLEKRIAKFSIKPLEENNQSLLDRLLISYKKLILKISNWLDKSVFIKKYSEKYAKYLNLTDIYATPTSFLASKLLIALLFVLIALFAKALQFEVLKPYEVIIPFLIGFLSLNLIYFSRYKIYQNKRENDLLQAIIIMNNAFKSGRSITQAIKLVSEELQGPIALEFKKMDTELSFGLGIDLVFERFSKRIAIEEVTYLTASLSILNKTGGNIIKVFSSIEESLFNKKKLKLELNALIGSSKIIAYVLFLVPIFFIVLVSLVNPSYFEPFFNNSIGFILLLFMLIYYIAYIIIVRKIMKVRM